MLIAGTPSPKTRLTSALALGAAAAATVAGAWAFQAFGYLPCELCLKQRLAYYAAVPISGLVAFAAARRAHGLAAAGFVVLALIFAANALFGAYHSGVEWGLWQGPTDCSGVISGPPDVANLMSELAHIKIVRCDEVQLRVLWLSLANWNALICAALAALALRAASLKV